jgi:hypothetical protein
VIGAALTGGPFSKDSKLNTGQQMMKRLGLASLMVTAAIGFATASAFSESMCFERHYDAAHLADHPDQLVTSMTLALDPDGRINIPFDFKIAMTKRGDNNLYVQLGPVENRDGQYRGVVECDGGGFVLQKDRSGVLLSIGLGPGHSQGIRMAVVPDPCGESDRINNSVRIDRGKDDHAFRLDAVSTKVCSRLFDKIDWNAVGRQNQ